MKKNLLPLLTLLLSGLLLGSCEKPRDWNCNCTVGGQPSNNVIMDQKKDDAQTVCDGVVRTAQTNRIAASCTLTEKK